MIKTVISFKGSDTRLEIWTEGLHAALGTIVDVVDGPKEVAGATLDLNPNPDEIRRNKHDRA